jgi:hypothetical protein
MSYLRQFGPNDIYVNEIRTHPQYEFVMWNGTEYINNRKYEGVDIKTGTVNLYEYNVNRAAGEARIFPFVEKGGGLIRLNSTPVSSFTGSAYGSTIQGEYPLTASIARQLFDSSDGLGASERLRLHAMRTTFDYYKYLSPVYDYETYYSGSTVNLISIPSIMFGSRIKPGSLDLKIFHSGTLVGRAKDIRRNGELICITGSNSGSVVGVALYGEGFLALTSSDTVAAVNDTYAGTAARVTASWIYFGSHHAGTNKPRETVFSLEFKGTHTVPVVTMMAHANSGEMNNSLNPTFISSSVSGTIRTSSNNSSSFIENDETPIKNTVESPFANTTGSFEKQTFISKVGVYDENRNLIAIAKLAQPIRKREEDSYTFKLKLDL